METLYWEWDDGMMGWDMLGLQRRSGKDEDSVGWTREAGDEEKRPSPQGSPSS